MITVTVEDKVIKITPVTVAYLPEFMRHVEPIIAVVVVTDEVDQICKAILQNIDHVIEAVIIGAGVEREWLQEQTPDVLVELASKVIEVNADFFGQRIMPKITEANQGLSALSRSSISGRLN